MVACGAELVGGVTGLDPFDCAWLDVVRPDGVPALVLSSSPSPPACDVVVVPVEPVSVRLAVAVPAAWVVRPIPTAAPRALTTLSPARPAWRRRLRLMCVMTPPSAAGLCLPCEPPGVPVSVSGDQERT